MAYCYSSLNPTSIYIYALTCPITSAIRYIGQAVDWERRYEEHCTRTKKKTYKKNWIFGLKQKGLVPNIEVIDLIPVEEADFWEEHYISLYKSWDFKLTNLTTGGNTARGLKWSEKSKLKARHPSWFQKYKNKTFLNITKMKESFEKEHLNINFTFTNFRCYWRKLKRRYKGPLVKNRRTGKGILQYDIKGNFIKTWGSSREIVDFYNVKGSQMSINKVCQKRKKTALGFKWCYEGDNILLDVKNQNKCVYQYDSKQNLLKQWNYIKDAAKDLNFPVWKISRHLKKTSIMNLPYILTF